MAKKVVNAKIACLDFSLQKEKMKLGIHVLVNDPSKLESIRQRESDITKVFLSLSVALFLFIFCLFIYFFRVLAFGK